MSSSNTRAAYIQLHLNRVAPIFCHWNLDAICPPLPLWLWRRLSSLKGTSAQQNSQFFRGISGFQISHVAWLCIAHYFCRFSKKSSIWFLRIVTKENCTVIIILLKLFTFHTDEYQSKAGIRNNIMEALLTNVTCNHDRRTVLYTWLTVYEFACIQNSDYPQTVLFLNVTSWTIFNRANKISMVSVSRNDTLTVTCKHISQSAFDYV